MKPMPFPGPLRQIAPLGLMGAVLLCAGSASAGSVTYQVVNNSLSGGSAAFPVVNDLTFTNLHLTETFADNFTASVPLEGFNDVTQTSLDAGTLELDSDPFTLADPTHGSLQSAVLTGSFSITGQNNAGPALALTLQPTLDPASQYQQLVSRNFSASLLGGPPSGGIGVGAFSLLDSHGNFVFGPSVISAAPVPEASTPVSLGLMLLLALGGLVIARRRRAASGK